MEVYQSSKTAAEMEYALGAVPSIGENGNWWIGEQDTGIFAKGINVTGAEIGQTVKVAAVDENGVPTAWEPADSAANDWRLLNTIETTEEIAVNPGIVLTEADDGTPYNHAEFFVTWVCPAASGASYATFQVNGKSENTFAGSYFASGAFINTSEKNAIFHIYAYGDAALLQGDYGLGAGMYGEQLQALYDHPGQFKAITSLQLSCYGNMVYPVGLKIKIWGRSA